MGSKAPAVIFDIGWNACINCGACVAVCPQPEPFISPFDTIAVHTVCDIGCLVCEDICPVSTISHVVAPAEMVVSAAYLHSKTAE